MSTPIRTIRARICSTVAREREGRSGSFMEDLTQDVRHVRKNKDLKQQETVFQSQWVFTEKHHNPLSRRSDQLRG
ncbi:hypothetical protein ALP86_102309 [Pseudomonas amygdali pv. mori]|nr:hypothetical protein ALP86_102309 [Pseudomonas amygdali pv. mori]